MESTNVKCRDFSKFGKTLNKNSQKIRLLIRYRTYILRFDIQKKLSPHFYLKS